MSIDPITLEVINNRLTEIALTMEWLLFHGGYSTILRESFDGSACMTDVDGRSVVASGYPEHNAHYFYHVQGVLKRHPIDEMRDGDSFLASDPYAGGSIHVPDIGMITPVFYHEKVVAFCVSIAHEPDMGGMVPASCSPDAREIFHEGILLPAVRFWTSRGIVKDVEAIIRSNTRIADILLGDLRAHVGCTRAGADRLRALFDEYGLDLVLAAFAELQDASEERVRTAIRAWPDGESEAEQTLDVEGYEQEGPIRVHVRIEKRGESLTIDLSKSSPQVRAPINLRPQGAETGACLAFHAFLDPSIPINHGAWRVIKLINPEGRITNAQWPAPLNNYSPMAYLTYLCVLSALNRFDEDRAVGTAGFSGAAAYAFGFPRDRRGEPAISYELAIATLGATPKSDGTFGVEPIAHIVPSTPVEITETEYPLLTECLQMLTDSGGPGKHRGGIGHRKKYIIQDDATMTVRLNPLKSPGWGVLGGKPSSPDLSFAAIESPGSNGMSRLAAISTREVHAGDEVTLQFGGGGGWGDPFERDPEQVLEDVLNRFVTVDGALRDYGVAIDPATLTIDREATGRARCEAKERNSQLHQPRSRSSSVNT